MNARRIAALALLFIALPASAYIEPVHQIITGKAYEQLNVSFVEKLGIQKDTPIAGERADFWMSTGAHDEDSGLRARHHFFSPTHNKPLTAGPFCNEAGVPAIDWAIEPTSFYGNEFSLHAAKLDYATAIHGPNPGTRDVFLKQMFIKLGHVMHLVQDMAQPEHTRNDQHLNMFGLGEGNSLWEYWSLENLAGPNPSPVALDGYETVTLGSYYEYFQTGSRKGMANYSNLNFVTQDTNYHDEDRNWRCPLPWLLAPPEKCLYYTEPRLADAARRVETVAERIRDANGIYQTIDVEEEIFTSFPRDNYRGSSDTDPFHTFYSSVDLELRETGCTDLYSLSEASFLSRAALLMPRATAYSAGIVEHIFRGSISAQWEKVPNVQGVYNLSITNTSTQTIGADARITVLYLADPAYFSRTNSNDTMMLVDTFLAGLVPETGLAPGSNVIIPNIFIPYLQPNHEITQFERRILIRGTLGGESDAVISLVEGAAEIRFVLDAPPASLNMLVTCSGIPSRFFPPTGTGSVDYDFRIPLGPGETCRAIIQSKQAPQVGNEGTAILLNLKTYVTGELREDISAVIDAGDTAVAGCHTLSSSSVCDRFIQRTGQCVTAPPPQNKTCTTTYEPWAR